MPLTRRELLTRSAAGAGVVALGNIAGVFGSPLASAAGYGPRTGYGDLVADPNGLLDLPPGFRYTVVSQEGTPLTGHAGIVPGRFDGTGAFDAGHRGVFLVRNSENGTSANAPALAAPQLTYDPGALGGTTTVELSKHHAVIEEYVSLAGTISNCAGGVTPWGTWLTCEETEATAGGVRTKDHGFVFEVDPTDPGNNVDPTPITAMGRYAHEAVAIDPRTGSCYLTEDASGPNGLVYRFTPNDTTPGYGALRNGGTLTAMRASRLGVHVPDLAQFSQVGTRLSVEWVPVPDPLATTTSVRKQFTDAQVTRSRKYEGTWYGDGLVWIVCSYNDSQSAPSLNHAGQVWSYDPSSQTLRLEVQLAIGDVDLPGESPDNICVSPHGGLILAEDGDGTQHLLTVDEDGAVAPLARNARDESEFAGCVFSPDGKTLFASIQDPGTTFAIEGPWSRQRH
jgi:secreted PhoX family phosphatase